MRGTILRTSATTPLSNWRSFVKFKHYLRRQPSWDPLLFFAMLASVVVAVIISMRLARGISVPI